MYSNDEKMSGLEGVTCSGCGRPKPTSLRTQMWESYNRYARRRFVRPGIVTLCLTIIALQWISFGPPRRDSRFAVSYELGQDTATATDVLKVATYNASETKLHFLVTANNVDIDICRTLLTSGILTYPSPTILGSDEHNHTDVSRFPGISRVLNYVRSLEAGHDAELVLIVDGHNTQIQLPIDILLSRYNATARAATEVLKTRLKGSRAASITQSVIFGADKRCASAAARQELCHPTPPSPAADDLYGNYTDVAAGYNDWFHYRQKYVNTDFIMGPLGMVRELFERAEQIATEIKHGSDLAVASEQAVFGRIFSEQERWREGIRSNDAHDRSDWLHIDGADSMADGKSSSSAREVRTLDPSTTYEFGMLVDYFSELSHSSMNSDFGHDTQFLRWNDDDSTTFYEQANNKHERSGKLDCVVNVPSSLPADLLAMGPPFYLLRFHDYRKGSTYDHAAESVDVYHGPDWVDVPLYTHLCFGTVPVMIHHSDRQVRNQTWEQLWLRQRSNALLQMQREVMAEEGSGAVDFSDWADFKQSPGIKAPGGAWRDNGRWMDWWDICPVEVYGESLFHRDP